MRASSLIPLLLPLLLLLLVGRGEGQSVAVLGGGVSGLTVAHELTDRGFSVEVPLHPSYSPCPSLAPFLPLFIFSFTCPLYLLFFLKVYERQTVFGGKARSYEVEGTGQGGRDNLPGEHGFRIFWNYYLNMFNTLQRIAYNDRHVSSLHLPLRHSSC